MAYLVESDTAQETEAIQSVYLQDHKKSIDVYKRQGCDLCISTFYHVKCVWIYRSFGITGVFGRGYSIDRSSYYA